MANNKKLTADVKRMLQAVRHANTNINRIGDLLKVIRSRAEKVTTSYSDTPAGGHNPDSRADTIAKLVDLERQQQQYMQEWCQAIVDVQVVISWLDDPTERAVLEHRYINCEDWLSISFTLNYSVQHIYRIHGVALYKLSLKLRNDERK